MNIIKTGFFFVLAFSHLMLSAQKFMNERAVEKSEKETSQFSPVVQSEETSNKNQTSGKLQIHQDPRLQLVLEEYASNKEIQGYKIQLYSGNNRMEAVKVKSDFISKFQNESPVLIYHQPNFKIRVGNYRSRLEAHKFLEVYKVDFPSAFLVKDKVDFNKDKKAP